MAATLTTADKIMKFLYTQKALQNAVYDKNPAWALMPKSSGFTGRSIIHALTYGNSNARSAAFLTALARAGINGATGSADSGFNRDVNFTIPRQKNYAAFTIEQELLLAAAGDKASFIKGLTQLVDGTLQTLRNDFGRDLYGDGTGALGQVTNVASLVLTVGEAVTQFEVGMEVVASTGSTATAILRNSGTGQTISAVNRSAGTVTISANTDTITTGDWLFIKGDRPVAAITNISQTVKIAGFNAWNPIVAPTSGDNFFGTDRSVDVTRLAGQRLDISGFQPEEGYITALAALAREDGEPSHIFTSFTDEKNLKLALGSRVDTEYTQVGEVGFESIRLRGPNGTVKVYADRNAPVGTARLLSLDTWEVKYLGDMVNRGDAAGDGGMAREYQADRYEGRMSFYGNIICYAPHKNMVCSLPT